MHRLLIYLARWQISGVVMMIPCSLLIAAGLVNPYINIAIASLFGGLVFYKIDKKIWK